MILIEHPDPDPDAIRKPALARFLGSAQRAVGLRGEVNVLLATDAHLQQLNRDFRGKNKPTDVLSFPAVPNPHGHGGDLAISLDTAAKQAKALGHTLDVELKVLTLHGLLHLSGLDHETDEGEMATKELKLRTKLGLSTSLIDRVTAPEKRATKKAAAKKTATKRVAVKKAATRKVVTKKLAAKKTAAKKKAARR